MTAEHEQEPRPGADDAPTRSGADAGPPARTCDKQEATPAFDALSPKHKAFVDAYCKCWNACQAARAAGYSESSATAHASRMLRRDDVQAAIEEWKRAPARRAYALLKPAHKAFLDAYCRSWNAGTAGVAAGYSEHFGYRLLRRDDVRAALIERQALAAASKEVEISEVVATLTQVLRANMLDYMSFDTQGRTQPDFTRLTRDQASVISELNIETRRTVGDGNRRPAAEVEKLRFKLHDKLRAADKLLRHLGAVQPKEAVPPEPVTPPPAKPISNRDRAKAILFVLANAQREAQLASGLAEQNVPLTGNETLEELKKLVEENPAARDGRGNPR
jgi:phage terminase small subunit